VEPPEPPATVTVKLAAAGGNGIASGRKNWKAQVTVTVEDITGTAIVGAVVTGTFAPGGNGTCTTGSGGRCTMTSGAISSRTTGATWTLTGISGTGLAWDGIVPTGIDIPKP
jgi:hypothetical protein